MLLFLYLFGVNSVLVIFCVSTEIVLSFCIVIAVIFILIVQRFLNKKSWKNKKTSKTRFLLKIQIKKRLQNAYYNYVFACHPHISPEYFFWFPPDSGVAALVSFFWQKCELSFRLCVSLCARHSGRH